MTASLLLDEHVEHEVCHRLRDYGHDVEHIKFHDSLEQGDADDTLADYSLANDIPIVTYDDDFEVHHDESDYWGVLFFSDDSWSASDVADTVHEILRLYDSGSLRGMNVVGREWL